LINLHPGQPEDPIRITLVTADLSEEPSFEALSYVWGHVSPRDHSPSILIDDLRLNITESVHNALQVLRSLSSMKTLWVDQICVNQQDLVERQHQVLLMADVYQTATSVIVYLGQPTEQTEMDMQHLQLFLQRHNQGEDAPWSHIAIPDLELSISRVLSKPWFKRIWTVQEAVLAQHIVMLCGRYQIQWAADLQTLRGLVFRIKSASISPMYRLSLRSASELDWSPLLDILESQMRQAARREGVVLHRNLLDVAFDFRQRNASDPRDKYYAILGIIEDNKGGSLSFAPNYAMSAEQVYEDFKAEIQRIGEIDTVPLQ